MFGKYGFRVQTSVDKCETCGSTRNNRNVRKYETREKGTDNVHDVLIQCSDCTELDITLAKTARLFDEILDTIDDVNGNLRKEKAALETELAITRTCTECGHRKAHPQISLCRECLNE